MKSFAFALSILFIMFIIGSNALSSSKTISLKEKERRESFQACVRLKTKAPNLNLRCENLYEQIPTAEEILKNEENKIRGIKFLSNDATFTRKVNKSQEIKLRNLIKKLTSQSKLRD